MSIATVHHDEDFYGWTQDQAAKLRRAAASRVNLPEPVDFEKLAEEIESLGVSQLRELYSRYIVLLIHLLKWQYQPDKRTASWRSTINTQRREIADILSLSPGLKPKRPGRLAKAFEAAREDAAEETGLPLAHFPEICPYSIEQIEDRAWWPAD